MATERLVTVKEVLEKGKKEISEIRTFIDLIETDLLSEELDKIQSASIALQSVVIYLTQADGFQKTCATLMEHVESFLKQQTRH